LADARRRKYTAPLTADSPSKTSSTLGNRCAVASRAVTGEMTSAACGMPGAMAMTFVRGGLGGTTTT